MVEVMFDIPVDENGYHHMFEITPNSNLSYLYVGESENRDYEVVITNFRTERISCDAYGCTEYQKHFANISLKKNGVILWSTNVYWATKQNHISETHSISDIETDINIVHGNVGVSLVGNFGVVNHQKYSDLCARIHPENEILDVNFKRSTESYPNCEVVYANIAPPFKLYFNVLDEDEDGIDDLGYNILEEPPTKGEKTIIGILLVGLIASILFGICKEE